MRFKEAPFGLNCPYKNSCPCLDGLSTHWIFSEYQQSHIREHEHWLIREEMSDEISVLVTKVHEQEAEIDLLRAENKRLHQQKFKPRNAQSKTKTATQEADGEKQEKKKRGAPVGHPHWPRKVPDRIDRIIEVDPPCACPHCQEKTDLSNTDTTSYIQEDIVLKPQTVVTSYIHGTAYCPKCRRQVIQPLDGELPFAPIGPNAKTAALYLRHDLKLPYRKLQQAMSVLFGFDFVPASSLGFEYRARKNADPLYADLIEKMRTGEFVHADESYWRQDGENYIVWHAGNEDTALFHIDKHRSAEAAKVLLGDRLEGLLITDGYASYNSILVKARQSCLAHLLRRSKELGEVLSAMEKPDQASVHFCKWLTELFKNACAVVIPPEGKARTKLKKEFLDLLDLVSGKALAFPKAETLRKRLIPGAREYKEVFAFIEFNGPPTNNHAERALRPLVIFRKVCMGTRSSQGSENIAVFTSLTQTAKLQQASVLELFKELLVGTPARAQDIIFDNSS